MTIRVDRPSSWPQMPTEMTVTLDGVPVGIIYPGERLDIRGSGATQQLGVCVDGVASSMAVADPGAGTVVVHAVRGSRLRGLWSDLIGHRLPVELTP